MELDDFLYAQVKSLSDQSSQLIEEERYDEAVMRLRQALELLPPPQNQWEAATWLYGSLGDALFEGCDFINAKEALFDALNCPDGPTNPFIHLRLGQALYELEEFDKAAEHLVRAYMLDGYNVFEGESQKYLDFMRNYVVLE